MLDNQFKFKICQLTMKLLSIVDLRTRWKYTKGGMYKLAKSPNFPKPFMTVSNGKVKLYAEATIQAYETDKPWLFDEEQKRQRQRLFGLLSLAKVNDPEQINILQHAFGQGAKPWKANSD